MKIDAIMNVFIEVVIIVINIIINLYAHVNSVNKNMHNIISAKLIKFNKIYNVINVIKL